MTTDRYHHRRPIDHDFYDGLESTRAGRQPEDRVQLPPEGVVLELAGGDAVSVIESDGPQIVHLFAWNPHDSDERIWPHETSSVEDAFLRRHSRIWGTMARYRPLLTVLEDTVETVDHPGEPRGRHHFVLGGWEVPAIWRAAGGSPEVPSAWERMRDLIASSDGDSHTYRDHISLFQKISIGPTSQRLTNLRSDAKAGDQLALFAEIDLRLALLPSPYGPGGIEPRELSGAVSRVELAHYRGLGHPPGWPLEGVPYPDITSYVDQRGQRR
jgi:uncharacterized protein YcgI (DUF1989 family)